MARHRLLNCEFVNASSFKVNISNKAKLLYFTMCMNADDMGYVDTVKELINTLVDNDKEFNNTISLDLLENTYESALNELIDKSYLLVFTDNHKNKIYLIKHWFYHNNYKKGLWTNYRNFKDQVYLESGEYILGKKPLKENKLNEDNVNQNNSKEDMTEEDVDNLLAEFKDR